MVFLVVGLWAGATADAQVNFVPNGGFEQDKNNDGRSDGWFMHPTNAAEHVDPLVRLVTSGGAPEGDCYLDVSKRGGRGIFAPVSKLEGAALDRLEALGDVPLVFSGKIRAKDLDSGGAGCMVQIFAKTAEGRVHFAGRLGTDMVEGTMDWMPFETTFRLSDYLKPGEKIAYIEFGLEVRSNTGVASFDAISLSPAQP